MGFFKNFPYTNFHEMNLDWVLKEIENLKVYIENYTAVNKVAYAGIWDITKQYPQWAIVTDGETSWLSLQSVPVGIPLENADYWQKLADLDPRIAGIIVQLSKIENDLKTTTEKTEENSNELGKLKIATEENSNELGNLKIANVLDYGAIGDGVVDDSDAIQLVFDTGLPVYFPKGLYLVSKQISCGNVRSITGAGMEFSKIKLAGNIEALRITLPSTIRGIAFEGVNSNGVYSGSGIVVEKDRQFENDGTFIDKCMFINCNVGIHWVKGAVCIVDKCIFQNNNLHIQVDEDFRNSSISNCYMVFGDGIYCNYHTIRCEGLRIVNNAILTAGKSNYAIALKNSLAVTISDNILDQLVGTAGIWIMGGVHELNITNNWIGGVMEGARKCEQGIKIEEGCDNVNITSNTFVDFTDAAIKIFPTAEQATANIRIIDARELPGHESPQGILLKAEKVVVLSSRVSKVVAAAATGYVAFTEADTSNCALTVVNPL